MRTRTPIIERVMTKVRVDVRGCWIFMGSKSTAGYGRVGDSDRRIPVQAHRVTYTHLVGEIPAGLQLDHLCRVPACVNPEHLEPVTQQENTLRGLVPFVNGEHNRAKTHCPAGHAYDATNTRFTPQGYRYCRVCKRRQSAVNYQLRRAAS